MGEVYWIAGVEEWQAPVNIEAWLNSCGLKIAWIDEIFWLTESDGQNVPDLPNRARSWIVDDSTSHRLLQLILNDMLCDMNNLVVLAESRGETVSLAVLATAKAVGRYNLLPKGRLQALKRFPKGQFLIENEVDPGLVSLLATIGSDNSLSKLLPSIERFELPEHTGLISSVIVLLKALINKSAKAGILLDRNSTTATYLEVL